MKNWVNWLVVSLIAVILQRMGQRAVKPATAWFRVIVTLSQAESKWIIYRVCQPHCSEQCMGTHVPRVVIRRQPPFRAHENSGGYHTQLHIPH